MVEMLHLWLTSNYNEAPYTPVCFQGQCSFIHANLFPLDLGYFLQSFSMQCQSRGRSMSFIGTFKTYFLQIWFPGTACFINWNIKEQRSIDKENVWCTVKVQRKWIRHWVSFSFWKGIFQDYVKNSRQSNRQ